jgi:hypothetical protein
MAKLFNEPANTLFGFTLSDARGIDPVTCGQSLRVYNYWQNGSRSFDITLKKGNTPTRNFPPYDSYSYESHPESGDRIESRKTLIYGSADPKMQYNSSDWIVEKNDQYYQKQAMVTSKAGQSVQFMFQGSDIYWRSVASNDAGKADVYIDGVLQKTVDCYFQECALPYQFAFIKTGLDPKKPHTIKIVVRKDKNPDSTGTNIRHIAFECATQL